MEEKYIMRSLKVGTPQAIKSRRIRWAGHVARMGERRDIQGFGGET